MSPRNVEEMQEIARQEGQAISQAIERVLSEHPGGQKESGGMLIAVAVENAEGWWDRTLLGDLRWREPATDENQHIEVFVRDAGDKRILPCLEVDVTVIDQNGDEVDTKRHKMFWHPMTYHYGANWSIPGEGIYDIMVHVDIPDFPRHNRELGNRYVRPVDVTFEDIQFKPGT